MAYSRLDWNPPARRVAGGGCKISPEVIFTNNNNKKQNEVSLYTLYCKSGSHKNGIRKSSRKT
jgi:hypothetical protein